MRQTVVLTRLFARAPAAAEPPDARLYAAAVARAAMPDFYRRLAVPDSFDGRFDLLVLHVHLLVRRLGQADPLARETGQRVFDRLVATLDVSLRDLGVSDLKVGARVKEAARGYYGRAVAYDRALADDGPEALIGALARNLYATATPPPQAVAQMAAYVRRAVAALESVPEAALLAGEVSFPDPLPEDAQ